MSRHFASSPTGRNQVSVIAQMSRFWSRMKCCNADLLVAGPRDCALRWATEKVHERREILDPDVFSTAIRLCGL